MISNVANAAKRIKRVSIIPQNQELDEFRKRPIDGIKITLENESDLFNLVASIDGPKDSVYENGVFKLRITISEEYPMTPPEVIFETPVFHPNVSGQDICLDILHDQWSPALKLPQVLLSISSLLVDPNPENGFGNEATELMLSDIEEFNKQAKQWVLDHATQQQE